MKKKIALVMLTGMALILAGCGGADGPLTVRASFDDVADLAPGAPVLLADIQVGKVTNIELENNRALITMAIEREARVPRDVVARARRTSLLGERIIDFEIPPRIRADAPLLQDGQTIARTDVRPDLEDLVREGTQVLSPISASEIATLVNEGARGFAGRGQELRGGRARTCRSEHRARPAGAPRGERPLAERDSCSEQACGRRRFADAGPLR
jgi:virulence factor Mce-like protein